MTDGVTMAGDGQIVRTDCVIDTDAVKVAKLIDGGLVGFAGSIALFEPFIEWLNGKAERPVVEDDHDLGALVLDPDGALSYYHDNLPPSRQRVPAAIGTGRDFAFGALDMGATPAQAVEIAARRDIYTGGRITVIALQLGDPE